MSGPGVSGSKARKAYTQLGNNASVTVEPLDNDLWAQEQLRVIAKAMPLEGHEYLGSACFHMYAGQRMNVLGEMDVAFKHQLALGDTSELVVQVAVNEFTKQIMRHFGHKQKTIDPKYKASDKL